MVLAGEPENVGSSGLSGDQCMPHAEDHAKKAGQDVQPTPGGPVAEQAAIYIARSHHDLTSLGVLADKAQELRNYCSPAPATLPQFFPFDAARQAAP